MTILQSIILGIVQGISEFLPISSSGHLVLIPALLKWDIQSQAFDVVVHLGTLVAVLIYFRKKLCTIFKAFLKFRTPSPDRNLGFAVMISTIPAAIIGFLFGDSIESAFRSPQAVAISLIFWGLILFIADRYSTHVTTPKDNSMMRYTNALLTGLAQVVAFIPGTSRSGITITAGLFQKFSKSAAAEFSFLMSIPVILLAGAATLKDVVSAGGAAALVTPVFVYGFLAAAVSGFFSIWLTLAIVRKLSFTPFVIYRILLGIVILLFIA